MIQTLSKRSYTHQNYNEDNYVVYDMDTHIIGAVFDGCSTGKESHFASTFLKLSFDSYVPFQTDQIFDYKFFLQVFGVVGQNIRNIKSMLNLSEIHMLSTVIFFMYDKQTKYLDVAFLGDGSIFVNDEKFTNNENNIPDYLAYHVNDVDELMSWLKSREYRMFKDVEKFAICTDGIDSLINVKNPEISSNIAVDFLFSSQFSGMVNGLNKKYNIITNKNESFKYSEDLYYWENHDDLTIVKYENIQ